MALPVSAFPLEQTGGDNTAEFYEQLDAFVVEVIQHVDREMRGQPTPMVYELITLHLARRLPGIDVDQEVIRNAAARIAIGLPPT